VTVTAGDAGGENFRALFPDPATQYRIKGWIRTWDSITVPFYGGVYPGRARNLGYYDATLRQLQAHPTTPVPPVFAKLDNPAYYRRLNVDPALRDRPFGGTWESLVGDLLWELERVRPTVVVATHPVIDAHPDHQFMTLALIEALARWDGTCELYLDPAEHVREDETYPFGDRDAMAGLPPWSGGDLFFSRLYSHPLTPEEQRLKLIALEAMHDLRDFDLRDGRTPRRDPAAEAEARRYDYYRRAPRPTELFLVVTRADAFRMHDALLAPH
jgi:LmbE family N-acetylglucosaminyl deacetylase